MKKFDIFVNENKHKDIDPYNEENWSDNNPKKDKLIRKIKKIVEKYGGYITTGQLEADSSPLYKEEGDEIHLIETLTPDDVTVIIYGGYKYEEEIDEYDVLYEKLEFETLDEIKDLLDEAIENGLLEEDV